MDAAVSSAATNLVPSADEATASQASVAGVVLDFQVVPPSGEVRIPDGEPRRKALAPATWRPSAEQATATQFAKGDAVGFQAAPEFVEQ